MRELRPRCRILLLLCVQLYFVLLQIDLVWTSFFSSKLPRRKFIVHGNISIGVITRISQFITQTQECDDILATVEDIHSAEVVNYAFDRVNKMNVLPGNLSLGFVLLDDCFSVRSAILQSLTFMPQVDCDINNTDLVHYKQVVGVIGCQLSSQTIPVARLLSEAEIPLISLQSSSDELSKKDLYPYFLRTATPDKYQFRGLFFFLKTQGWSYISMVFVDTLFGTTASETFRALFRDSGICLALDIKVSPYSNEGNIRSIVKKLILFDKARVVILIAMRETVMTIIRIAETERSGHFIWVGDDTWGEDIMSMKDLGSKLWGAITITQANFTVPEYDSYFRRLTLNATNNPWFPDFWKKKFNCSLDIKCNSSNSLENSTSYSYAGRLVDLVHIYANAIAHTLSSPGCSTYTKDCVTGPRLLQALQSTQYNGYLGRIQFDEEGNFLGKYHIRQVRPVSDSVDTKGEPYLNILVAEFDSAIDNLTFVNNLTWNHHSLPDGKSNPDARCSEPCPPKNAIIFEATACCWRCVPCRINERLVKNRTKCEACSNLTWPNDEGTYCILLNVYTPNLGSGSAPLMTFMAIVFFISCLIITRFFRRHKEKRVIKASACHLSYVMLFAISLGCLTVVTMHSRPSNITCRLNYMFFCLSLTLLYAPLLIRALCIYRIFSSARTTIKRPFLVRPTDQMLLTCGAALVQLFMSSAEVILRSKWYDTFLKEGEEPFVEVACVLYQEGITAFLVYNLFMLLIIAVLAYKTRDLPDNFNESRYISVCVSTTLLGWLIFIPSYIMAPREYVKTLVMSMALILNHSVALVFLFLPRVYAVLYVNETDNASAQAIENRTPAYLMYAQKQYDQSVSTQDNMQEQEPVVDETVLHETETIGTFLDLVPDDSEESNVGQEDLQQGILTNISKKIFFWRESTSVSESENYSSGEHVLARNASSQKGLNEPEERGGDAVLKQPSVKENGVANYDDIPDISHSDVDTGSSVG